MAGGRKSAPVCPVCDSTEYVLRQGEYFCRMCNTQSQELGITLTWCSAVHCIRH